MKHKLLKTFIIISFSSFCLYNCVCVKGYEIVAHGKVIGFVEDSQVISKITQQINDEISSTYGFKSEIEKRLNLTQKITLKENISTSEELWENISKLSGFMSEAYVLNISGEEKIAFKSYNDMVNILSDELSKYNILDSKNEFIEKIEYEKKYVSKARICDYTKAKEYFKTKTPLNVKSIVKTCYNKTIDFEVIEKEDNSIYIGDQKIIQEGKNGEKTVSEVISYINGKENSKKLINETIIREPVSQIVSVGTKTPPPGVGTGSFSSPVAGVFTSGYGQRWGRLHGGIDLAAKTGTKILAADSGKVVYAQECNSYGLLIKIDHSNGYLTYYAHCDGFIANVGDCVKKGDAIAYVGDTGNSTGPHCHFEIRYKNSPIDPLGLINI